MLHGNLGPHIIDMCCVFKFIFKVLDHYFSILNYHDPMIAQEISTDTLFNVNCLSETEPLPK